VVFLNNSFFQIKTVHNSISFWVGGYFVKQLLPEQAAMRLNHVAKAGIPAMKSANGNLEFPWPGFESEPINRDSIKM
jgi:hypothetical protein